MWLAIFFFLMFCVLLFNWCAGELNESQESD